jgi:hypothetical protein
VNNGGSPPNSSPVGPSGNVLGETWLDGRTAFSNPILKVFNGTQWKPANGFSVDNVTGHFTLQKRMTVDTLVVNGTPDGTGTYLQMPVGPATGESSIAAPSAGMVRYDTTNNRFRGYNGSAWADLSSGDLPSLNVSGNASISGNLSVEGNTILGDASTDTVTVNAETSFVNDVVMGSSSTDTFTVQASSIFTSPTSHVSQQQLRFHSGDSTTAYVAFKAPAVISASVIWTLPATDGNQNEFLRTDGSGNLSWSLSEGPIQYFDQTITPTLSTFPTSTQNGLSVGPLTISSGAVVTVPSGCRWTII